VPAGGRAVTAPASPAREARPPAATPGALTRISGLAPFALAGAGGFLYALGFVGFGVWPLALVAWVPLWAALEALRRRRAGPLAAAGAGLAFGVAAYATGYAWLWRLVAVFLGGNAGTGAALFAAHGVWFAGGFAVQALLFRAARTRGWPVALAGVPALVATEWLYPALFPLRLGNALVDQTAWIQTADLGGPLLLSGLAGLANALAYEAVALARARLARRAPRARRAERAARAFGGTFVGAGLVALAVLVYGAQRMEAVARESLGAPALRVGLVQAHADVLAKRRDPERVHRAHLAQTRELVAEGELDLVVWPETVYSRGIAGPLPVSGELIRGELRAPLLFGAASVRTVGTRRLKFNSALLVDADGVIRSGYDKNLLVPFAESVPVPALAPLFPHAEDFGAGESAPALRLAGFRIATPICFEAVEPAFVRRMVAEARPHLLVTLANDGWFGDSQEPRIHLAVARLRAVEHRRYLVRATNSGISAVVDPLGRVVARTRLLAQENLRAGVRMLDGAPTVYGRLGDWPGALAAGLVALAVALPAPSRDRRGP